MSCVVLSQISDDELAQAKFRFPHCTPQTKEAYYYREVFEKKFSPQMVQLIPYIWMPKWMDNCRDPSARVLSHYQSDETKKDDK